jgi:Endonuclease NucS C-terminal domain
MYIEDPQIRTCSGKVARLLVPPHMEKHEWPEWLKERALERIPELRDAWPDSGSDAVSELIHKMDTWDWLDHWGTATYGGKRFLVSEPYHMNRERVDQLLRFCDSLNLKMNIQASGHHYPTLTMRVFVWPEEWNLWDEFQQEDEGYDRLPGSPTELACKSNRSEATRGRAESRSLRRTEKARGNSGSSFPLEGELRDHLARNLQTVEDGMTLWPVNAGQTAIEFVVDDRRRRIDILAKDRNGLPTVIETKVDRGHEKTVGQILYYQERIRELFKVRRVRVIIVARRFTKELRIATNRLPDVSLLEYSRMTVLKRV